MISVQAIPSPMLTLDPRQNEPKRLHLPLLVQRGFGHAPEEYEPSRADMFFHVIKCSIMVR